MNGELAIAQYRNTVTSLISDIRLFFGDEPSSYGLAAGRLASMIINGRMIISMPGISGAGCATV